ncbi:MAG: hypothetical protein M1829_005566 [Trizodia sp. TS-e1964]|nr:MAG: hypothetical protein M1829_005566 [Trizodia sp. TS-e1964]
MEIKSLLNPPLEADHVRIYNGDDISSDGVRCSPLSAEELEQTANAGPADMWNGIVDHNSIYQLGVIDNSSVGVYSKGGPPEIHNNNASPTRRNRARSCSTATQKSSDSRTSFSSLASSLDTHFAGAPEIDRRIHFATASPPARPSLEDIPETHETSSFGSPRPTSGPATHQAHLSSFEATSHQISAVTRSQSSSQRPTRHTITAPSLSGYTTRSKQDFQSLDPVGDFFRARGPDPLATLASIAATNPRSDEPRRLYPGNGVMKLRSSALAGSKPNGSPTEPNPPDMTGRSSRTTNIESHPANGPSLLYQHRLHSLSNTSLDRPRPLSAIDNDCENDLNADFRGPSSNTSRFHLRPQSRLPSRLSTGSTSPPQLPLHPRSRELADALATYNPVAEHTRPVQPGPNDPDPSAEPQEEDAESSADVGPKCSYTSNCNTESPLRKVVSHIFGRNKLCTRQIPKGVWVHYCRKHYQRSRYRNPKGFALLQCDLVRKQIDRLVIWGGVTDWIVKVRKREEVRLNKENAELAAGRLRRTEEGSDDGEVDDAFLTRVEESLISSRWLTQLTGTGKTTEQVLSILERIEREISDTSSNFPDVEILPNVTTPRAPLPLASPPSPEVQTARLPPTVPPMNGNPFRPSQRVRNVSLGRIRAMAHTEGRKRDASAIFDGSESPKSSPHHADRINLHNSSGPSNVDTARKRRRTRMIVEDDYDEDEEEDYPNEAPSTRGLPTHLLPTRLDQSVSRTAPSESDSPSDVTKSMSFRPAGDNSGSSPSPRAR